MNDLSVTSAAVAGTSIATLAIGAAGHPYLAGLPAVATLVGSYAATYFSQTESAAICTVTGSLITMATTWPATIAASITYNFSGSLTATCLAGGAAALTSVHTVCFFAERAESKLVDPD